MQVMLSGIYLLLQQEFDAKNKQCKMAARQTSFLISFGLCKLIILVIKKSMTRGLYVGQQEQTTFAKSEFDNKKPNIFRNT